MCYVLYNKGLVISLNISFKTQCLLFFFNVFAAHSSLVAGIIFSVIAEFVLSVGRDKYFQWHCSESGRRLGGFRLDAWGTAVQYPS